MVNEKCWQTEPAAVLAITGEDAADFLQNQGTADLRGADGLCRYSLFLDHKGLVHGDAYVLRRDEESFRLVSYAAPASMLAEKLNRHIIADDVEIEDLTNRYQLVASRSEPPRWPEELTPESGCFQEDAGGYWFRGRLLGRHDYEFLLPRGKSLPWECPALEPAEAERLRIEDGIPLVGVDVDARHTPLDAGLLSCIAFDKGCYLGQEVVARQHRLGRSSRKLVRFRAADSALEKGMELSVGGRSVGEVTSLAPVEDGWVGLAMVKAKLDPQDLARSYGWTDCEPLAQT